MEVQRTQRGRIIVRDAGVVQQIWRWKDGSFHIDFERPENCADIAGMSWPEFKRWWALHRGPCGDEDRDSTA